MPEQLKRYVYAAASAIVAGAARVLLDKVFGYHHPYATFYVAVLWSAAYGGVGPGILAMALGGLAAVVFAIPPPFLEGQGFGTLSGFEFYFLVSLTGVILLDAQRRAEKKSARNAQRAREELAALERETVQRRQAEESANRFEQQLRMVFEYLPAGICHIAPDGAVVEANPGFCEMFGYPRQECLGIDFFRAVDPDGRYHAREQYGMVIEGKQAVLKGEFPARRRDGTVFSAEIAVSILRGGGGDARGGVAIVQDITGRKRAEEQLREAQKLESVGLLAGGIAHDFNNLLTGVLGNASLAEQRLPEESDARAMLGHVIEAAKRAAELTSQLLAYAGRGAFVPEEVDLSEVVRRSLKLVSVSLPPSIEVRANLREHLPAIRADVSQIQQMFANLAINGGEAIGEDAPGRITITTDTVAVENPASFPRPAVGELRPGTYVFLRVEDTGRGMDEGTIDRIFDPFFTTRFMGRGLGLAAVSGIVRAQRGAVLVVSAPGAGSTFSVLLPVARPGRPEAPRDASAAGSRPAYPISGTPPGPPVPRGRASAVSR